MTQEGEFYVGEHVQVKGHTMQIEAIGLTTMVLRLIPNQKITEHDIAGIRVLESAEEERRRLEEGFRDYAERHFNDTQKHTMFVGGPKND